MRCFNPRTRVGCDDGLLRIDVGRLDVSIHAPAWGATQLGGQCMAASVSFNPRTRVGCDLFAALTAEQAAGFQSTHPRGVRRGCPAWQRTCTPCFNPRTRVGCDARLPSSFRRSATFQSTHPRGVRHPHTDDVPKAVCVSIHAPAWGATPLLICASRGDVVSIHAPAWGATQPQGAALLHLGGFNPRTRVGCDMSRSVPARPTSWFQSTHPRGVRLSPGWTQTEKRQCFNPRTRVGCDMPLLVWGLQVACFNPRTRVGCDCFHVLSSRFP